MIDGDLITAFLLELKLNQIDVYALQTVDSTMNFARDKIDQGVDTPFLVVANQQTAGYGRRKERSFYSPKDSGIYMTLIIDQPEMAVGRIMAGIGYVLTQVLDYFFDQNLKVKWLNDVLDQQGRKIAGSLIEIHKNKMIIGIGINLNTDDFPIELTEIAGSLTKSQDTIRRELIIARITEELMVLLRYNPSSLIHQYKQVLDTLNRQVTLQIGDQIVTGMALDVDYDGQLLVQTDDGRKIYYNIGEVIKVNQGENYENDR